MRASNTLRVVLYHENLHIADNYENSNSSYEDEGLGELIGFIFGEALTALTDDEYNIEYYRKGMSYTSSGITGNFTRIIASNERKIYSSGTNSSVYRRSIK